MVNGRKFLGSVSMLSAALALPLFAGTVPPASKSPAFSETALSPALKDEIRCADSSWRGAGSSASGNR